MIIRGGAGQPSTEIVGAGGVQARNISFQYLGWNDGEAGNGERAMLVLNKHRFVACQMVTPTELRLEQFDDTLGRIWGTSFSVPPYGRITSIDHPLQLTRNDGKIHLLCYRNWFSEDTILTIVRTFDSATGTLLAERKLHLTYNYSEVPEPENAYHVTSSPDGSYYLTWIRIQGLPGRNEPVLFALQLLRPDYTEVLTKVVRFEPSDKTDMFLSMHVNDRGEIFMISAAEDGALFVTKKTLLGEDHTTRLTTTITDQEGQAAYLFGGAFKLEDENSVRVICGAKQSQTSTSLAGVAFVKFDFNGGYVPVAKYTPIPDSVIEQIYGDKDEFTYPAFRACLVKMANPAYVLLFEQNISNANYAARSPFNGDVLMLAFDSNGEIQWRQGFRKEQAFEKLSSSFATKITSDQRLQFIYLQDKGLVLREYHLNTGEPVDNGRERLLLTGPDIHPDGSTSVLIPTMHWLSDNSFLASVRVWQWANRDIKLLKLDY